MRCVIFVVLAAHMSLLTGRLLAGDKPVTGDELTTLKRDYADVLALEGTSKGEILAIARILRANPEMAIDLISDALPFSRLWYGEPNAISPGAALAPQLPSYRWKRREQM